MSNSSKGSVEPKNTHKEGVNNLTPDPTLVITDDATDTVSMDMEQLNRYIVTQARSICENVRKQRDEYRTDGIPHTSDIIPPFCYMESSLRENIDNMFACYSNTLSAALFCESQYIKKDEELEALETIVKGEKQVFFDFLSKNGLTEKFNEFCIKRNWKR